MKSEFTHLNLDLIRYSLVWEDSQSLYEALEINNDDHLLIITSAGCNVLNALLKDPALVTAIDLNPFQNKLLLLKKHIIQHHEYEVFHALLGFAGNAAVSNAKQELMKTLPASEQPFWLAFFEEHPGGLLSSGKLENYITSFYDTLDSDIQEKLQQLIRFTDVKAQYDFFKDRLDTSNFKQAFIAYYSDENLKKGRDSNLLKYAADPIGPTFYKRLLQQVGSAILGANFHFRFFFFGLQNMPADILPPCYRRENYTVLRQRLHKIWVFEGEALDHLLSERGSTVTKAALSNIFEYISHEEFDHICQGLIKDPDRKLRLAFWNLLNGQGEISENYHGRIAFKNRALSPKSSFYFKNVIHMQFVPEEVANMVG
jgi:S-adenosylmethionine-diacylglycerol 3-amino-3-carboxypropyl transferase